MSSRYNWEQGAGFIRVKVQVRNPNLKNTNCDLQITRTYVRLHMKSPKLFLDLDLWGDIDPGNPANKTLVHDDHIELILTKLNTETEWSELVCKDKQLAKARREEGWQEYLDSVSEATKQAEERKIENDRFSITEQMRIEDRKRRIIEDRLASEKARAESELYSSLPDTSTLSDAKTIFHDPSTLPSVRQSYTQPITFTPKTNPLVPTRESSLKEPPMPQPLKPIDGPAHESHPTWLKDKGNEFYKNRDYNSAINAYSKGLKNDPDHLGCLMNRSLAFIRIGDLKTAMDDVNHAQEVCKDEEIKAIILARKAAIYAWKGYLDDAIEIYKQAAEIKREESIGKDIELIKKRKESNRVKIEGDISYRLGDYEKALNTYLQALDTDPKNETVMANLAQVYLKLNQRQNVIKYCEEGLERCLFNPSLKVKLLLRKAQALDDPNLASKEVEQALSLEPNNKQAKSLFQILKQKTNQVQFQETKSQADLSLKEGKHEEALSLYKKCLKLCTEDTQKSAIYANLSVCHLLLNSPLDVISVCERGLSLSPEPEVRLRLLTRRAKAYGTLGQLHSAEADLKQAIEIQPENVQLKSDLELIRSRIQTQSQ
jgi:dyslexia susceptibility 1 candidate gene 1 protein